MAQLRRAGAKFEGSIWPGFVDAMTALLLILIFVLSIFMIVQFTLRENLTGATQQIEEQEATIAEQRDTLESLSGELAALAEALSLEREERVEAEAEAGTLRSTLQTETTERTALEGALADLGRRFDALSGEREQLAAALEAEQGARSAAEARITELDADLTEREAAEAALAADLAALRDERDAEAEAARKAAAERDALDALVADLERRAGEESERLEGIDAERARALALLAALEDETTGLRETQSQQAARIAELEAELAAGQTAIEAAQAARVDIEAAEAEQAEREAALARAEAERAAAEAAQQEALARLSQTAEQLTAAEEAKALELAAAEALRRRLAEADDEMTALTLRLEEARREAEETLTLLAAAEAARDELAERAETTLTDAERAEALRRVAEQELAEVREQAEQQARRTALLNRQVAELRTQLGSLQALLDESEARDEANQVQIQELGSRLNAALAQRVSELSRFRSEFFGRMREVLGGRDDVTIVGDRFVFQSEVLFAPGSATLDSGGLQELAELGTVLRELLREAPEDVDWILRVDGHTDRIPISGGRFRDNWELSQARALSVVQYLIDQEGVPPTRLAATGFGEYQPLVDSDDPAEFAVNRRIEFKFTER